MILLDDIKNYISEHYLYGELDNGGCYVYRVKTDKGVYLLKLCNTSVFILTNPMELRIYFGNDTRPFKVFGKVLTDEDARVLNSSDTIKVFLDKLYDKHYTSFLAELECEKQRKKDIQERIKQKALETEKFMEG